MLLLHYPLKKTESTEQVEDHASSGTPAHGLVQGGIQYVPSGLLGHVASFAESKQYIQVPSIDLSKKEDATILFWYKAGYQKNTDNTVLLMEAEQPIEGTDLVPRIAVRSSESEEIEVVFTTIHNQKPRQEYLLARESPSERLRQIAIVFSGKKVQVYLNGVLATQNKLSFGSLDISASLFGTPILSAYKKVQLGNLGSNVACQIGQFRLFDEALTQEQIKTYYQEDLEEGTKASNNALVLDLSFGEVRDQKIQDISESGQRVRLEGTPKTDFDAEKGSAVAFDGEQNFAHIAPFVWVESDGFSFETWMRLPENEAERNIFILYQQSKEAEEQGTISNALLRVYLDDIGFLKVKCGGVETMTTLLPTQQWIHVAFSLSNSGGMTTYLDGMVAARETRTEYKIDWITQELFGFIGGDEHGKGLFKGNLKDYKLYRKALTKKEVIDSIQQGQAQHAARRTAYPLDVKLQTYKDDDYFSVLYIEPSGKGSPLVLDIQNTAPTALIFKKIERLDEQNYHFQLRFRQNVIYSRVWEALKKGQDAGLEGWKYALGDTPQSREQWISFQRSSDEPLKLNASVSLSLPNVSAEPLGGARNTRAEIKFSNIAYNDAPDENLSGFWMRHFDIVSHAGMKHTPLVASVAGIGTLLNDGASLNTLSIYIANPNPKQAVMLRSRLQDPTAPTKFIVRFQSPSMTDGNMPDIKCWVEAPDPQNEGTKLDQNVFDNEAPTGGEITQNFIFQANKDQNTGITPETPIRIDITDWVTRQPSGMMHVFVDYHNIPGYWDGTWVIPVQFGRMVQKDNHVGIGIVAPKAALHIKSSEDVPALNIERGDTEVQKLTAKGEIKSEQRIRDKTGDLMPVGSVIMYAGREVPKGWLRCEGQYIGYRKEPPSLLDTVSGWFSQPIQNPTDPGDPNLDYRPEFKELRAIIGDYVPDLRDRFIVGAGSSYGLNNTGGEAVHTLTENEMPRHNHSLEIESTNIFNWGQDYKLMGPHTYHRDFTTPGLTDRAYTAYDRSGEASGPYTIGSIVKEWHTHSGQTTHTGSSYPHENRPPYYALYYIIKY